MARPLLAWLGVPVTVGVANVVETEGDIEPTGVDSVWPAERHPA
jgi:hypothetical protein